MATSPRIVLAIVSVALLVTSASGCSRKSADEPVAPVVESQVTEVADAEDTAPPSVADQYASSMQPYAEMSVEAFEALPRDERLLYSQYLIDWTSSREELSYSLFYADESAPGHQAEVKPVVASRENNGQEIVDAWWYVSQIAKLQYLGSDVPDSRTLSEQEANPRNNVPDAQKVLSSAYYIVGEGRVSNDYSSIKNWLGTLTDDVGWMERTFTATDTSELRTGKDQTGASVEYKDVTFYTDTAPPSHARFVYHEFPGYDGKGRAVWLLDMMADSPQGLSIDASVR